MCHDNIYLTPYLYPESCRSTEGLQGNSHEQSGCAREVGTVVGGFGGRKGVWDLGNQRLSPLEDPEQREAAADPGAALEQGAQEVVWVRFPALLVVVLCVLLWWINSHCCGG